MSRSRPSAGSPALGYPPAPTLAPPARTNASSLPCACALDAGPKPLHLRQHHHQVRGRLWPCWRCRVEGVVYGRRRSSRPRGAGAHVERKGDGEVRELRDRLLCVPPFPRTSARAPVTRYRVFSDLTPPSCSPPCAHRHIHDSHCQASPSSLVVHQPQNRRAARRGGFEEGRAVRRSPTHPSSLGGRLPFSMYMWLLAVDASMPDA